MGVDGLLFRAVLGDVTLKSLHMGFIPVESDVLSLETENYFRDVFLNFDLSVQTTSNNKPNTDTP